MKYRNVIFSGTFDHIHRGHEVLLEKAFTIGKIVTVCVTTDAYVARHKASFQIQPYGVRVNVLKAWIAKSGYLPRVTLVPIDDAIGPAANEKYSFDAIVVSEDTKEGANRINTKRKTIGLKPLAIITIPMVSAKDLALISSSRVRNGEIDIHGNLRLPVSLRSVLRKPFGEIISDKKILKKVLYGDCDAIVISVGDQTTKNIIDMGIVDPQLIIIDMQVQRKPFHWDKQTFDALIKGARVIKLVSGPGYISSDTIAVIKDWATNLPPGRWTSLAPREKSNFFTRTTLIIDGEEDLLVLPVIKYAPLHSVVYYGQPRKGMVRVVVTNKKKIEAKSLMERFTIIPPVQRSSSRLS